MGVSQNQKKLDFKQLSVCKICGKYSNIEVYMTYWYFMFFFIPIIKWNKEYYIKTSCCEMVFIIDPEIGRKIEQGEEVYLNIDEIDFGQIEHNVKICTNCGYTTEEDFKYCPKCSNKLQ